MASGSTVLKSALVKRSSLETETSPIDHLADSELDSIATPSSTKDAVHRLDAGSSVQAIAVGDGVLYAGLQGGQIAVMPSIEPRYAFARR